MIADLAADGMFQSRCIRETAGDRMRVSELDTFAPKRGLSACTSAHVYFSGRFRALPPTIRRSGSSRPSIALCARSVARTIVNRIYEWAPLAEFFGRVMANPASI